MASQEESAPTPTTPNAIIERSKKLKAQIRNRLERLGRELQAVRGDLTRFDLEERKLERSTSMMAAADRLRRTDSADGGAGAQAKDEKAAPMAIEGAGTSEHTTDEATSDAHDAAMTAAEGEGPAEVGGTASGGADAPSPPSEQPEAKKADEPSEPEPQRRQRSDRAERGRIVNQRTDVMTKQRNRNLFGVLLGPLKRARDEASAPPPPWPQPRPHPSPS